MAGEHQTSLISYHNSFEDITTATFTKFTTSANSSLKEDGSVSAESGSFAGTIDAQSVVTWVGKASFSETGIDRMSGDRKRKKAAVASLLLRDLNNSTVYDLHGRRLDKTQFRRQYPSGFRSGLFLVRNGTTGDARLVNVVNR